MCIIVSIHIAKHPLFKLSPGMAEERIMTRSSSLATRLRMIMGRIIALVVCALIRVSSFIPDRPGRRENLPIR
ncbi:hypothetical protein GGR45_002604 [Sphingomonas zeae]|jgi:hypothetical protein|nr:hypothetical protein [Sphingomonas zeae]